MPVFWPGECHGLYSPWGLKKSDTTEPLPLSLSLFTCAKYHRKEGAPQTWKSRKSSRASQTDGQGHWCSRKGNAKHQWCSSRGKFAPPRGIYLTMSRYIFACHSGGRCTGYRHLVGRSHTEQPQQHRFIHPTCVTRIYVCLCLSDFPYT